MRTHCSYPSWMWLQISCSIIWTMSFRLSLPLVVPHLQWCWISLYTPWFSHSNPCSTHQLLLDVELSASCFCRLMMAALVTCFVLNLQVSLNKYLKCFLPCCRSGLEVHQISSSSFKWTLTSDLHYVWCLNKKLPGGVSAYKSPENLFLLSSIPAYSHPML